jgi:nucleoside diphosphate kinase
VHNIADSRERLMLGSRAPRYHVLQASQLVREVGKTEPHAARPGNLRRRHAVVVEGSYINVNGSRHAALRIIRSHTLENLCA